MKLKEIYDKIVDFIYDSRKNIIKFSFTALALLLLIIVLYFSSDKFNVNSQVDTFINYIEDRQYVMAETYYDDLEKEFSDSKMNRFNNKVSNKLSSLLRNSGDMYVNSQITKEQYMGLINVVNTLKSVNIDISNLIDLGKRVDEMYKDENITYDVAVSYIQITSSLQGVNDGLDEYRQHIKTLYESRNIYKDGTKKQSIKKYYEAIELYNKVLEEDKKYYTLAQNAKKVCIEKMHDFYISEAKSLAKEGKYEEALKNLNYLDKYYNEDEISKLEDEYNKYISNYTMTSDDIINLISRRSDEKKEDLSVVSYLQTVNGKRYYYGEVSKGNKVINEVLVDTETKKIYSYKSDKKDYDCKYSDAYFKIDEETGEIILSIDKQNAQAILEDKLNKEEKKYKKIETIDSNSLQNYMNDNLKNMMEKNGNIYYYFLIKAGWFKPKEVYMVNIYDKTIYAIENNEVTCK